MSNDIDVTISGSANAGKSTIARLLKLCLQINTKKQNQVSMGENITIDDFDGQNDIGDLIELIDALNRLSEKGTKINIKTVQTPRENNESPTD
jgi:pantothenate kinase